MGETFLASERCHVHCPNFSNILWRGLKEVPFDSHLGRRVLNDLSKRYPQFKPKCIVQEHIDGTSSDIVAAYSIGLEDVRIVITNKEIPIPEEYINDIHCVSYTLTGSILIFYKAHPVYKEATIEEHQIRPDLLEFYERYQQIKESYPDIVKMIEAFAAVYEKQLAEHNETYEPLALRELLWNFTQIFVGS